MQKVYAHMTVGQLTLMRKKSGRGASKAQTREWLVQCSCGSEPFYVREQYLIRTKQAPKTHCGCKTQTFMSQHKAERNSWYMMHVRCLDPKHVAYESYGGRGITICERWHWDNPKGFENFVEDLGRRPANHTLDRIEVDGNYEPSNTRWATSKEQANNQRWHKTIGPRMVGEHDPPLNINTNINTNININTQKKG